MLAHAAPVPTIDLFPAPHRAAAARPEPGLPPSPQARPRRWSADGWLLWRAGEGETALAPGGAAAPAYGGSQGGAVLRYALAPGSRARPAAYVRVVQAFGPAVRGAGDGDIAAGLSARPLRHLPLTAHGELRASRRGDGVELRPAAFLTTGIDSLPLPAGATARGYAQAGYVGGRGATAFADGSLIAERELARRGGARVEAGAGTWGGVQRGAGRLDIGPTVSLRLPLGPGSARMALDYRHRIAGNAAPAGGAALTLTAGF